MISTMQPYTEINRSGPDKDGMTVILPLYPEPLFSWGVLVALPAHGFAFFGSAMDDLLLVSRSTLSVN